MLNYRAELERIVTHLLDGEPEIAFTHAQRVRKALNAEPKPEEAQDETIPGEEADQS